MTNQTKSGLDRVRIQTTTLLFLIVLTVTPLFARPVFAQSEGVSLTAEGQTILEGVNQARVDNGLPPLVLSPALTLAAQRHVDDVIAYGNWGHYGSDGSNVQMRVARVGYSTSSVSENWVAVADPNQAIVWWMNDWIHRVNILEGHWDEIGVGVGLADNGYWILVTDFGNIDGGAMPPVTESASVTSLTGANASAGIEAIPDNGEYAIRSGDTLLGIAIRYGLDWQDIALSNNMGENELLQIDRVIRLPGRGGTGGLANATTPAVAAGKQTHAVRAGETLWTIAARFQIPWQDIAAVNGLGEYDLLQVGQNLKLPASLDEPAPVVEEPVIPETTATDAPAPKETRTNATGDRPASEKRGFVQNAATAPAYTVRGGDTLLAIALRNDITWQDLAAANGLDEDSFLQIGQELTLPSAEPVLTQMSAPAAKPVAITPGRVHRIEAGDTIYAIALQYDVDWQELLRINDLDEESMLQLDQELKLP